MEKKIKGNYTTQELVESTKNIDPSIWKNEDTRKYFIVYRARADSLVCLVCSFECLVVTSIATALDRAEIKANG